MRISPTADVIECPVTGEALHVRRNGMSEPTVAFDPHMHTNNSDGSPTIERLCELLAQTQTNGGITDHNMPPDFRQGRVPVGIVPGIEVTSREHVHIVGVGPYAQVVAFFDNVVRPKLGKHWSDRTGLATEAILEGLDHFQLHCVLPHWASTEGGSLLPPERQKNILASSYVRERAFLERNSQVGRVSNAYAVALAQAQRQPWLCASDAHTNAEHGKTSNEIDCAFLDDDPVVPLATRLLNALHTRNDDVLRRQYIPRFREQIATLFHVTHGNSLGTMAGVMGRIIGRELGLLPKPTLQSLAAPTVSFSPPDHEPHIQRTAAAAIIPY